jgi:hypothetical protein
LNASRPSCGASGENAPVENQSPLEDADRPAAADALSPELVLILPAAERAEAIASLGPPVWPEPPRVAPPPPAPPAAPAAREEEEPETGDPDESFWEAVASLVAARLVSLTLLFVIVTVLTLVLSLVASATR